MFNRTFVFHENRTEYVPYTKTVIEKRAPTDESIKIYQEMLGKARKSILDTIEINDNTFNVKAIVFEDPRDMERVCKYAFTINGKEIMGEVKERACHAIDKNEILRSILKKVSERLSLELIKSIAGG